MSTSPWFIPSDVGNDFHESAFRERHPLELAIRYESFAAHLLRYWRERCDDAICVVGFRSLEAHARQRHEEHDAEYETLLDSDPDMFRQTWVDFIRLGYLEPIGDTEARAAHSLLMFYDAHRKVRAA